MSSPLLAEVIAEIDANSVSFYGGGGRSRQFAKYGDEANFLLSLGIQKLKGFQLARGFAP